MVAKRLASEVLDREFLEIRHRLLDVAAALDRIDAGRHAPAVAPDPRLAQLREAVGILLDGGPDRVQRVQLMFSDPYDADWRGR